MPRVRAVRARGAAPPAAPNTGPAAQSGLGAVQLLRSTTSSRGAGEGSIPRLAFVAMGAAHSPASTAEAAHISRSAFKAMPKGVGGAWLSLISRAGRCLSCMPPCAGSPPSHRTVAANVFPCPFRSIPRVRGAVAVSRPRQRVGGVPAGSRAGEPRRPVWAGRLWAAQTRTAFSGAAANPAWTRARQAPGDHFLESLPLPSPVSAAWGSLFSARLQAGVPLPMEPWSRARVSAPFSAGWQPR